MKKVGLIGWRGMVGSVLMSRMVEENDFAKIQPVFFTTSQAGQAAPNFGKDAGQLQNAYDIDALAALAEFRALDMQLLAMLDQFAHTRHGH